MTNISVIILCKNEELHIGRCLQRLMPLEPAEVFIIDCYSTDRTNEIVADWAIKYQKVFGGRIEMLQREWPGLYAKQFNWALENCNLTSDWILRLDADEYLLPESISGIKRELPILPPNVSLIELPLRQIWFGNTIKFGTGVLYLGRIFKRGFGKCEERYMDEHTVVNSGTTVRFNYPFADDNINTLDWWITKHMGYARREAIDYLLGNSSGKKKLYNRMPLFWRGIAYFLYRYIFRGGFLEGKSGYSWHFFQGLWYRTLVDAKIVELKKEINKRIIEGASGGVDEITKDVIKELYGFIV